MTQQQEISAVPGTDTTVITERTGVQPDGREHVQSRIVWPPSPLSGQSRETRYPEQPARVRADLDEAEKVQVTKGRHEKACARVKDGTLTPPWYADVRPVGINDQVMAGPRDPIPTNTPAAPAPPPGHADMCPVQIPVTSAMARDATAAALERPVSLGLQGLILITDGLAAIEAGDVERMRQISDDLDVLLALLRATPQTEEGR